MKTVLEEMNGVEVALIERFQQHPVFLGVDRLSWDQFLAVLIQRRFLSLSIVNVYEFVIDAIEDKEIKRTVQGILHEEFPRNTKGIPLPSHRELLFQDLLNLGASRELILMTPETRITKEVREKSFELLSACLKHRYGQIGLVAVLRFWAEVLVSIEYGCLWNRISERLSSGRSMNKMRSEFYYFHMIHDNRNSDIGKESYLGGLTHSQELGVHLNRLISSEDVLSYCVDLEQQVYRLKTEFYDQFLGQIVNVQ